MNPRVLTTAFAIGLVLQLAMVVAGHYAPTLKAFYPFGGMGFSLLAGLVYGAAAGGSWASDLIGGVIVGAACALIGIAVSVAFKDVPASLLLLGTASSTVTGLIGAAVGRLAARTRSRQPGSLAG